MLEKTPRHSKYLHVVHIWAAFCLERGIFHLRWAWCDLPEDWWYALAQFIYTYDAGRPLSVTEKND